MKQIVPFTKNISFNTNVDEITSISLDKKVKTKEDGIISGVFDLYLEYKESDVSVDILNYSENIEFDIDIDEKYDIDDASVEIDDFYYELDGNNVLLHIDLLIDNLKLDDREVEKEIVKHEEPVLESEEVIEKIENVPIYESFDPSVENYVTYNVHIVRDDDTIDSICEKYGVTKEDLSYYNDITSIKLGDKLVVPTYKK